MNLQDPYPPPEREAELSLLYLLSILLRYRYTLIVSTIAVTVVVVALLLLRFEPSYTTRASFVPQNSSRGVSSGFEAVAGRLGISVGPDDGSESPLFYAELLRSGEVLRQLLTDTFEVRVHDGAPSAVRSGTLLDLLEIEGSNSARREQQGIEWLGGAIGANVARETSVVRFSVTTPWPELSRDVAARLLELVNEFNLGRRQSQASAERAFIEGRLVEAQRELSAVEVALKRFLEGNRAFENSPDLRFEHDRLQRQVAIRQDVLQSLTQSYEQSRIAQVRDTPLITVIELPREPADRDPRGLVRRGLLGLILGGVVGLGIAFAREATAWSQTESSPGYRALRGGWEETVTDLRRLFRRK